MKKFSQLILENGSTTVNNLLLTYYKKIGLKSEELLVYILIKKTDSFIVPMPNIKILAIQTGFSEKHLYAIFHNLITNKMVKIVSKQVNNKKYDAYDFSNMYNKLEDYVNSLGDDNSDQNKAISNSEKNDKRNVRQEIFSNIEKEFGRTLSPIELETISQWFDIDNYDPDIIMLALKEAVLNQVRNLKYMDRILGNWEKQNLKTVQQIEDYSNKRNNHKLSNDENGYSGPDIPIIDLNKI
ncbi:DnaD domain-containing protein [Lentilactobacillus laojiaonis]|uniref:DnaD domain-containing protein n=1 Tax=Lentilactobacillus laojiaonis TaxID=2883998 RepID=UPI001D0AFED0|nr:DnaD domain protein [Lentilactobacillus laojiaonis]UDM32729.1 DnaD domain protein [Lentilactobacillus laojiaonis]